MIRRVTRKFLLRKRGSRLYPPGTWREVNPNAATGCWGEDSDRHLSGREATHWLTRPFAFTGPYLKSNSCNTARFIGGEDSSLVRSDKPAVLYSLSEA